VRRVTVVAYSFRSSRFGNLATFAAIRRASSLVMRLAARPTSGLFLVIDVGKRKAALVLHDEARGVVSSSTVQGAGKRRVVTPALVQSGEVLSQLRYRPAHQIP
jgi:hypothetical protein